MLKQPIGKSSHAIPPLSREESEQIMNFMISSNATFQPKLPSKEPWFIGREGEPWLAKDPFLMQSVDEVALDLATEFSDDVTKIDTEAAVNAFKSLGGYVRTVETVHSTLRVQFDHSDRVFITSLFDIKSLAEEKLIHLTK